MTKPEDYRLVDNEPKIASELKMLLEQAGEAILASQVEGLSIVERVDDSHGTDFYMVPRSPGHWGPGHRTLGLRPGSLHIDVVDDKIVCVELFRSHSKVMHSIAEGAIPKGHTFTMKAAGITSKIDENGRKRWMLVGWSKDIGWAVMDDVPSFLTRDEAAAEYSRLKEIEGQPPSPCT